VIVRLVHLVGRTVDSVTVVALALGFVIAEWATAILVGVERRADPGRAYGCLVQCFSTHC
jgi:hypothetical protein